MATFLPTTELLRLIAEGLEREEADPVVVEAFDQLVLRRQLVPWLPGWWELEPGLSLPKRRGSGQGG